MSRSFVLVPDTISTETVKCLEQLLAAARKGEIIGLAYAAMMRRKRYIVNTAGEAHKSPTFTRGMLAALNDELGHRVRG